MGLKYSLIGLGGGGIFSHVVPNTLVKIISFILNLNFRYIYVMTKGSLNKALPPHPPSSLVATPFFGISSSLLVAWPLKKDLFAVSLKQYQQGMIW